MVSPTPTLSPSPSRPNRLDAPRPLRRCRSASPAPPPKAPMLSIDRQLLIKKSWQRLVRSVAFGDQWMADLTSRIGKDVFGEDATSCRRHTRHFMDLIQSCVENLNDLETALKPWLDTLGRGHAGFKIKARHWDAFGESLATTVCHFIGHGKSHKDTLKGWMILSSFLADRLAAASRVGNSPMLTPRVQLMTFLQP